MGKMPVLFVGHGSPMNAIEENEFTRTWETIAAGIPKPEVILAVSAHWYTSGSRIADTSSPELIYDMYGFPEELYQVKYGAKGSPELANLVKSLVGKGILADNSWGIDHGSWSVLCRMYPKADIPVVQFSVDYTADAGEHYKLGQKLAPLRDKGVLILGSGNVVHNLSRVNWDMAGGYGWADEFDRYIREKVNARQFQDVIQYGSAGESARYAFDTPDHFFPLLYVLGASDQKDSLTVWNDSCVLGALSMTCYLFS